MNRHISIIGFILSLLFAYAFTWVTFSNEKVFWYFYTFTILFLMSFSFFYGKISDNVKTSNYVVLSILTGILLYIILALGYFLIEVLPFTSVKDIDKFSHKFGPTSIWHFLLLLFLIAPGEELFWRGYIQQQIKRWISPIASVVVTAGLFSLTFFFSGFWFGMLGAFVVSIVLGLMYEWKKSMPLIILSHITMLVLLFLLFPLTWNIWNQFSSIL